MGEIKHVLAKGEYEAGGLPYSGRFVIEDCVGETVHLHIGHLRMEFTPAQFLWFADKVSTAAAHMRSIRGET